MYVSRVAAWLAKAPLGKDSKMESAALFLLASGIGVMFGWQPMPDGSPRYEYVVQLDPELVASLEEGQSVPITSDIPEEAQPIGRIRIVVGRGALPRTPLSASFEPSELLEKTKLLERKGREGLIETQHRVPPVQPTHSERYSNTSSQAILPPNSTPPNSNQRFAQSLQNAAQPAGNGSAILPPQNLQGLAGSVQNTTQQLGNQIRNVGESVRTDAQQMFGQAGNNAVGNAVSGVVGQMGKTVDQLQLGFQQSVQPLGQAAQRTGQQIRSTVEGLGQRTRETLDQFGRPLRGGALLGTGQNNSQTILPPNSTPPQQNFATGHGPPHETRTNPPAGLQRDNWQAPAGQHSLPIIPLNASQPALGQATNNNSNGFSAPSLPRNESRGQASQPIQPPAGQARWPNRTPNDSYDMANHSTNPSTGRAARNTSSNGNNFKNDWLNSPNFPTKNSPPSSQIAGEGRPASDRPAHTSSAPGISRDMLERPADAALQTVGIQPTYPVSEPTPPQTSGQQPRASDFGWDNISQRSAAPANATNEGAPRAAFPLILSWVLLTGSGAGNIYLIWSFWDVRSKYRGLVHNARGSSSGRY